MGNGDALTRKASRAQALACKQAVEHDTASDALIVFEDQAGLLEDTLLAAGVEIDEHIVGERRGDKIHGTN